MNFFSFLFKLYLAIRAIPKTMLFNFRYFPFNVAIQLPVIVSHRVRFQNMGGSIEIQAPIKTNMIRLGFHDNPAFDRVRERVVWHNSGKVIFKGNAYIGNGNKLAINGIMECGNNFQMSGNSQIVCKHHIVFGDDVLIGWDCLFMDGDAHKIYFKEISEMIGNHINPDKPINIGNKVWFGARCTVLKGSRISDDTVVAANSCVTHQFNERNVILAGYPAKVIKDGIVWRH